MKETWVPMVVGTYNESFCKLVLAGPPQLGKKNTNLLANVKNDHFRRCGFFRDFFQSITQPGSIGRCVPILISMDLWRNDTS